MKHQYLVVNGILSNPSDISGWTDLFEDFYQNEGYSCSRYEYFSGAITRFIKQGKRVEELSKIIKRINNPLVYVGHSNGCELFGRLMKESDSTFESAHLFAAAMNSDFKENGLNYALLTKRVKKIYLYCSTRDLVLKNWASKTSFLKFMGLGYGTLGLTGPKNVLEQVNHKVETTWSDSFDHSDWFKPENIQKSFDLTFR